MWINTNFKNKLLFWEKLIAFYYFNRHIPSNSRLLYLFIKRYSFVHQYQIRINFQWKSGNCNNFTYVPLLRCTKVMSVYKLNDSMEKFAASFQLWSVHLQFNAQAPWAIQVKTNSLYVVVLGLQWFVHNSGNDSEIRGIGSTASIIELNNKSIQNWHKESK